MALPDQSVPCLPSRCPIREGRLALFSQMAGNLAADHEVSRRQGAIRRLSSRRAGQRQRGCAARLRGRSGGVGLASTCKPRPRLVSIPKRAREAGGAMAFSSEPGEALRPNVEFPAAWSAA